MSSRADIVRQESPEEYASIAPLVDLCDGLVEAAGAAVRSIHAQLSLIEELEEAQHALAGRLETLTASAAPTPSGHRVVDRRPLSTQEESEVSAALGEGDPNQMLAEYQEIPVRRSDMRTIRPYQWLNDEVINLFFKLLGSREAAAVASLGAGNSDDVTTRWPRCHFFQTSFYTKLAESSSEGYLYKNVRRWTSRGAGKVDVFTKDLIIVPIHCHGNHWTLAVINVKMKRFEYFDSLFGSDGNVLANLRRWLEDEHQDKKGAQLDTAKWRNVVFKKGMPAQQNGSDCGVFMTRTADYLARDGRLDFTQADMPYFRRRMVLEILHTTLFPPEPEPEP